MKCWMCNEETGIKGTDYGDHACKFCGVMISVYNPSECVPIEKEEEEMIPQKRTMDFEKVANGEMINGVISKIEYDQEHKFTYLGTDKISPAARLVFELEGYKFPHRTRWMSFTYGERSNLYKKFLAKLVENAKPDMEFDLDLLVGMKIKTVWSEDGDFQNLDSIYPLEGKVRATDVVETPAEEISEEPETPEEEA